MTINDALPPLELGMQELEDLEAPGWFTSFKEGAAVSVTASAAYASIASAISVAAT